MIEVQCDYCKKNIKKYESHIKKYKNHFCSSECRNKFQQRRTITACKTCNKKFEVKTCEIERGQHKYCSRKCFFEDQKQKRSVQKKCKYCGKKFNVYKSKIKKGEGIFCSIECLWKSFNQKINRICLCCGKSFKASPSKVKNNGGKYCSKKCKHIGMSGESSSLWKGGTSFEPYCSRFNGGFKERCREFWDRKCGICGKTEKANMQKLSVHHVNYDKETCCNQNIPLFIPLCKQCHSKTGFNRNSWEEILTNYIMIYFNGKCYLENKLEGSK